MMVQKLVQHYSAEVTRPGGPNPEGLSVQTGSGRNSQLDWGPRGLAQDTPAPVTICWYIFLM